MKHWNLTNNTNIGMIILYSLFLEGKEVNNYGKACDFMEIKGGTHAGRKSESFAGYQDKSGSTGGESSGTYKFVD